MSGAVEMGDGEVLLRGPQAGDAAPMVEMCTDPDMLRFTTVPRDYTLGLAEQRIARISAGWSEPGSERSWVIETRDRGGPRFGGLIDLRPAAFPTVASLGYALHPRARGRGVMARAVRLVAAYAFTEQPWGAPVHRLHWTAIAGNWASRRVAWAAGFTFHGTLPGSHVDPADPKAPPLNSWQASLAAGEPMQPTLPWFDPPVIEHGDLRLRAWREDDIEAIEPRHDPDHWMPGPAVLRRVTFASWLLGRRERMAEGKAMVWCVAEATGDRALGAVLVFDRQGPLTGDSAELGYEVFPSGRGRGIATRAARLAIDHVTAPTAQGGLGLRRLTAETAADNLASNRVLTKLGFVAYGREHATDRLPDGTFSDALHWELLFDR